MHRSPRTPWISALAILAAAALPAAAQEHADCPFHEAMAGAHEKPPAEAPAAADTTSPYAAFEPREIAALGADETRQLLAGEGMGMALPAELHGFPGPRHVLDLADQLGLSAAQRQEIEAAYDGMHQRAVALGEEIIAGERELDRRFSDGSIAPADLAARTTELGRLRGELRAVHLTAHLEAAEVLSPEQRHRYVELRGYEMGGAPGAHQHQHTGHPGAGRR